METSLDKKTLDALRKKAEDKALEENKKKEEDRLYKQFLEEARVALNTDPAEEQVEFTLDLAPNSDRVVLDGRHYLHGQTVKCGRKVYDTIRDVVARGWEQQALVDGKRKNHYSEKNLDAHPVPSVNVDHKINTAASLRG